MRACMRVCGARLSGRANHRKERKIHAPVRFRDVVEDKTTDLPFDIAWLVADRNLSQNNENKLELTPRTVV